MENLVHAYELVHIELVVCRTSTKKERLCSFCPTLCLCNMPPVDVCGYNKKKKKMAGHSCLLRKQANDVVSRFSKLLQIGRNPTLIHSKSAITTEMSTASRRHPACTLSTIAPPLCPSPYMTEPRNSTMPPFVVNKFRQQSLALSTLLHTDTHTCPQARKLFLSLCLSPFLLSRPLDIERGFLTFLLHALSDSLRSGC